MSDINDDKNILLSPYFVTPTRNAYAALAEKNNNGDDDLNMPVLVLKYEEKSNFFDNSIALKVGVDNDVLAQKVNK